MFDHFVKLALKGLIIGFRSTKIDGRILLFLKIHWLICRYKFLREGLSFCKFTSQHSHLELTHFFTPMFSGGIKIGRCVKIGL